MIATEATESSVAQSRDRTEPGGRVALVAHILPFALWIGLMFGLPYVGPEGAWKYAVRTGVCTIMLCALRPWRWYRPLRIANLPLAFGAGVLVWALWVLPEIQWGESYPLLQELYMRFGILPLGSLPDATGGVIYAPENAGWIFALTRLAGSALTIAVIEEFFWRGFLYRWLIEKPFTAVALGRFDWEAFLVVCLLFGFEHNRWLAGIAAGVVYGLLLIRTRDIWAVCVAHVVTNLLLGLYVLAAGHYAFW